MKNSKKLLKELITLSEKILNEKVFFNNLHKASKAIVNCLKCGGVVFACGNGGSFTTAEHLTEELMGRYRSNRRALPAICLGANTPALTCIANDFSFDNIFEREVSALMKKGDVLCVFSTTGNSPNILRAVMTAKEKEVITIGILGKDGGKAKDTCDISIIVPHSDSARIQEIHTFILHIICEYVEKAFGDE